MNDPYIDVTGMTRTLFHIFYEETLMYLVHGIVQRIHPEQETEADLGLLQHPRWSSL